MIYYPWVPHIAPEFDLWPGCTLISHKQSLWNKAPPSPLTVHSVTTPLLFKNLAAASLNLIAFLLPFWQKPRRHRYSIFLKQTVIVFISLYTHSSIFSFKVESAGLWPLLVRDHRVSTRAPLRASFSTAPRGPPCTAQPVQLCALTLPNTWLVGTKHSPFTTLVNTASIITNSMEEGPSWGQWGSPGLSGVQATVLSQTWLVVLWVYEWFAL